MSLLKPYIWNQITPHLKNKSQLAEDRSIQLLEETIFHRTVSISLFFLSQTSSETYKIPSTYEPENQTPLLYQTVKVMDRIKILHIPFFPVTSANYPWTFHRHSPPASVSSVQNNHLPTSVFLTTASFTNCQPPFFSQTAYWLAEWN